jgi:hypothetical protein
MGVGASGQKRTYKICISVRVSKKGRLLLHVISHVQFINTVGYLLGYLPSKAALFHTKPASTGTFCDRCHIQGSNRRDKQHI